MIKQNKSTMRCTTNSSKFLREYKSNKIRNSPKWDNTALKESIKINNLQKIGNIRILTRNNPIEYNKKREKMIKKYFLATRILI